jgi:Flp pilus assembly protein TadG
MTNLRAFIRDEAGGPAAEFALVLPLALLFMFGIIDVGRFMWEVNKAEKATQMGARFAAVTNMLPSTLATQSFVSATLPQGEVVPMATFAGTRCAAGSCNSAPTSACPALNPSATTDWGYDAAAFTLLYNRMAAFKNDLAASNIVVDYVNVGLGFAGDPNGPDVAPLITVRMCNLTFQPITTLMFGVPLQMPDASYSLTLEDGQGSASN